MFLDVPVHDQVNGHGGITTNYFTLYLGLVPESAVSSVWRQVVDFGLEKIGDYSAFVMLDALARFQILMQLEKIVIHIQFQTNIAILLDIPMTMDLRWCGRSQSVILLLGATRYTYITQP